MNCRHMFTRQIVYTHAFCHQYSRVKEVLPVFHIHPRLPVEVVHALEYFISCKSA